MKNSKRIITLILAFAMIVSTFSFTALATTFSDITDEKVADAVAKLVANGIITGYEDGTFRPDNQITRAEFAAIVTRMKGVADTVAPDAKTGFADLDNDESRAWARPYVKAAVDLGIVNGFEDGTFRAGEPVTYEQAVKMLVCAAGYEIVAQSEYNKAIIANPNATWSAGYIAAAGKHGFTKGAVTGKISEPASRGMVALLTSNTIDVPPLVQNQDGSVAKDEAAEEKTIVEVKGIVSGTYYTRLNPLSEPVSLQQITILTSTEGEVIYELSESLAKSIDFEDLIGKGVTAYYNTLDRQLTSITKTSNRTTLIDEKSVIRPIAAPEIKYYADGKKSTIVDLSGYTIIYNGRVMPEGSDIFYNFDQKFTNGTIELVETMGKKFAKITSYDIYVVDKFTRTTGKISFKYTGSSNSELFTDVFASTGDMPVIYVDGVKKEYDSLSLKEFSVINFMESPLDGIGTNTLSKMYVSTKSYSGKVTAEIDKYRTVELGGKEIILTNMYNDFNGSGKAPFAIGDTYKYYLDYTGQIAAIDYSPATSSDYVLGYIIDADRTAVSMIKKDKSFEIVPMKDRVKVDGVAMDCEEVKSTLETIASTIYGESECSQPVRYIITNGELSAIDTAATSTGVLATAIGNDSNDMFIYNGGDASAATSKSSVKANNKTYQVSSSTMVIFVPEDPTNDLDYSIMAPSKAFASSGARKVKVFGADPEERVKQATMVLIYGVDPAYDFIATTSYMVVSDIDRANRVVVGYDKATASETSFEISEDKFKSFDINDAYVTFEEVGKGDVIRYIKDATGAIAIEMIYDADDNDGAFYEHNSHLYENDRYFSQTTSGVGDIRIRYAEAFYFTGTTQFTVTKAVGADESVKQDSSTHATYVINSSTVVYRIDEDGNLIVEPGDEKYENISITEDYSSKVIVFSTDVTNNTAKAIYIVE